MYPKQHAVVSAAATLLYAVGQGLPLPDVLLWMLVGTAAGVFIDVDHAVLGAIIHGHYREAMVWTRQPVRALTDPEAFIADIDPFGALVVPRLVSHVVVLVVLFVLLPVHVLVAPAVIGLAAHILADVVWDVRNGSYAKRKL